MKIVIQRVKESAVHIHGDMKGQIGQGYMTLVGFSETDHPEIVRKMIDKMIHLRIFEDAQGKMNLSLLDVQGSILSISQFTLYADCRKGRRPGFTEAAKPERAVELYTLYNQIILEQGISLNTGEFGADMQVSLVNDGPVTILLDSEEICHFKK